MSQYRKFTVSETLQAVMVEIIRRLWHLGKFRSNVMMQKIVDRHFDIWIDWRTRITMKSIDSQAAEVVDNWETDNLDIIENFLYSEIVKGETPLFMENKENGDV